MQSAMQNLLQLFNKWEIQLLVLLSFMLQMFLFFTGSLRQRSTNTLLRGIVWIAYLGADLVAVYALGLISRHEDATIENGKPMETHPLAFFWAPFLLIHLGGQDTITAFAIEDNNLWLRHLLNLVIQVALASYVFWKSTINHNVQLQVPGIFVFVAGIIKYGERTVALRCGNLKTIANGREAPGPRRPMDGGYKGIICFALDSVPTMRGLFAGRMYLQTQGFRWENILDVGQHVCSCRHSHVGHFSKALDVELRVMYDDLYTKAAVLRTRSGIILRCISQVSAMVALVLFAVSYKQRYSRADIVVTYILFIGGFFLEFCALFTMFMLSPWTWDWLKDRECGWLTGMSWLLLSSNIIGWPERRPFWSNSMGQYSFLSCMGWSMIRKMAKAVGIAEEKLFRVSKSLYTKYEAVDDKITECLVRAIREIRDQQQQWHHLGPLLREAVSKNSPDFVYFILVLHIFTEVHLSGNILDADADTPALVDVCRKLSNYMFYLVVAHPTSMLQVAAGSPEASLEEMSKRILERLGNDSGRDAVLRSASELIEEEWKLALPQPSKQTLEGLRDMWARLLVYAAGKSRPEAHAAQLARGGERLTFVWLLLAHHHLGDWARSIELADHPVGFVEPLYTFRFPRD